MRDITKDLMKTVSNEELDKHRTYLWLGKPKTLSKNVFYPMINKLQYYERTRY